MSYYDVLFRWKREFTTKEFSSVFASSDPNKVLHKMAAKGLLEKVGWGKYRVSSPQEYLSKKIDVSKGYESLTKAGMEYALTGPDIVFIWIKGRYQVDRFFGFYPIYLKVKKKDFGKWKKFFKLKKQVPC